MTQKKKNATDVSKLRQRAEAVLKVSSVDNESPVKFSPDERKNLIHNLDVHQIELKMQNDELTRSQSELNIERDRYFDFYNMAPVGFFSVDEKKMIVECNHTAAKMLGRDQVEINKQPITAFILKEDQDIYYLHCKRPIEKHMPQGCDLRMLKNDGSSLWVNLVTIVFQNDEGVTIRRIVMNNITERKQAEETLRKSVDRYRHLFNSIKDNILVADTNRNIIDCNQALMDGFGYRSDEIIGKKTLTLYNSKKEYQKMGKELRKHFDNTNFIYTIDYKKKSGEIFPGETNVFYLENDKEEVVGFIGIIRDITYRRMVEESLQRSNNELKEKTVELEDTNTALKILLKKREQDNQELEENILSNYESMVNPFLDKLKSNTLNKNQQNLIDIVETTLKEIVTPFSKNLSDPLMSLTPSEIQIASMIKQGFSNKEIAHMLNNSVRTITKHRDHIREKLNLKNKKINLRSFLSSL